MVAEVTEYLAGRGTVVDMTLGAGGHAEALFGAGVGQVIGVDRDPTALAMAGERLGAHGDRFRLEKARCITGDAPYRPKALMKHKDYEPFYKPKNPGG